MSFKITKLF